MSRAHEGKLHVPGERYMQLWILLLGMFMDVMSMLVATVPITFPMVSALGVDPIHFGAPEHQPAGGVGEAAAGHRRPALLQAPRALGVGGEPLPQAGSVTGLSQRLPRPGPWNCVPINQGSDHNPVYQEVRVPSDWRCEMGVPIRPQAEMSKVLRLVPGPRHGTEDQGGDQ